MSIDLSMSQNYWGELEKYLKKNNFDVEKVKECYEFALKAHINQKRDSGEAYISHPTWIAKVTAQLDIGQEAVEAALLHDCVEDTEVTLEEIADKFGDEVALIVSGLTEVAKKTKGIQINQTNIEVFRKFLFSSVNDVRVLILRIIDKLHNGLTIKYVSEERQKKYAKNILGIYGPVAEYVGLHYFKKLIEDIAFEVLYEDEAKELKKTIEENSKNELKALVMVKDSLEKIMKINNIKNAIVEGRIKSLYSTFLKLKKKGDSYKIKDRVAVRILVDTVEDCYNALGLLHAKYQYLEDEFVDYIATPKPNGYRSIQTTVQGKNLTVEIQIKTKEMHNFNEFGPASHVAYKLGKGAGVDGLGMDWVKDLVNWQKGEKDIKNYRLHVLTNYIYVFTPRGDAIQMPAGSTALDFAYRIHTDIGDHCQGIKINGKMAKLETVLKTGDLVEALLSKKMNVNKNWLDVVKTQWAREHIRKMMKVEDEKEI